MFQRPGIGLAGVIILSSYLIESIAINFVGVDAVATVDLDAINLTHASAGHLEYHVSRTTVMSFGKEVVAATVVLITFLTIPVRSANDVVVALADIVIHSIVCTPDVEYSLVVESALASAHIDNHAVARHQPRNAELTTLQDTHVAFGIFG